MATSAELVKRAQRAEADGAWLDAAALWERGGEVDRAVTAYQKGGAVDRAAWLLSARVVAEVAGEAFVITRERFQKLVALDDKMALKLYRFFTQTVARRLRLTSERLVGKA